MQVCVGVREHVHACMRECVSICVWLCVCVCMRHKKVCGSDFVLSSYQKDDKKLISTVWGVTFLRILP